MTQNLITNNIIKIIKKRQYLKNCFFGTQSMFNNLNNNNIKQYFIDITYKIVPLRYKPYKLLTIKGFNILEKQSV